MMNVPFTTYINPNTPLAAALEHTVKLIAVNQSWNLTIVDNISPEVDLNLDYNDGTYSGLWDFICQPVDKPSIDRRIDRINSNQDSPKVKVELLPLIFYFVNCSQEIDIPDTNLDKYGRYRFQSSWQYRSENVTDNIVQEYINQFVQSLGMTVNQNETKLFITHDIDFLYNSRKEDLKWAALNWKLGDLIKIIFQETLGNPHCRNIDRVLKLDSEYDIRATFFWLVNDGIGEDEIPNADYNLNNEKDLVRSVADFGGYNGLHKSASIDSVQHELDKSNWQWKYNRNHYLRFNTSDHWRAIEESRIKLDCSLGFAEHYGFRNSYGKPFTPFDIENNRPYNFVEAPLHVMDATFLHYLKTDSDKIGSTVIDFIEKNKQDCVLSLLWHNNYLTDYAYKSFLTAYKEILGYIYENQYETITPPEIIEQYSLK